MTGDTVGSNFQHSRTLAVYQQFLLAGSSIDYCQRVVTVNLFSMELRGVETGCQTGGVGVTHGFTHGLTAHAVEVIEYVEQDRHTFVGILTVHTPQLGDLVHGSKVQGFQNRTTAGSTVTGVGNYDTLLVAGSLVQSSTQCDGSSTAYDSVVGQNTEGNEESVHGAAQTLVEAGGTGKDFSQSAVQQEVLGQILDVAGVVVLFNDVQDGTVQEFLHDVVYFGVFQLVDGGQTLCQDFTVGSVRTEGEVVDVQAVSLTNSGSFLTDGQVSRAGVVISYTVVFALYLDFVEHGFKLTNGTHIVVDTHEISLGIDLLFFFQGLAVTAQRNAFKIDVPGLENFTGIHILTLRHNCDLLLCNIINNLYYGIYAHMVNMASRITSQTVGWGNTIF